MLVRFTPKQIGKLKDFLKYGKFQMNGFDIQLYQEILKALDQAIDEKPELNNNGDGETSFYRQKTESKRVKQDPRKMDNSKFYDAKHREREEQAFIREQEEANRAVEDIKETINQELQQPIREFIPPHQDGSERIVKKENPSDVSEDGKPTAEELGVTQVNQSENTQETQEFAAKEEQKDYDPNVNIPTDDEFESVGMFGTINRSSKQQSTTKEEDYI